MEKTISNYLRYLKIPISKNYTERLIASHPNYPSLLSVVDILDRLGINYHVGGVENGDISELQFPFLLPLNITGEILFIKNDKDLEKNRLELQEFSGTVLQIQPEQTNISDPDHEEQYAKELVFKNIFAVLVISSLLFVSYYLTSSFSWASFALITSSTLGLILGYLLLAKDLGISFQAVENICKGKKNINCDTILKSNGAKIFSFLKFSDLVSIYFIVQPIVLYLALFNTSRAHEILLFLSLLSALTLPIIAYSLYYQSQVQKSWCTLCLFVVAILVLQASIFAGLIVSEAVLFKAVNFSSLLAYFFLFPIIGSIFLIIKNKIESIGIIEKNGLLATRLKLSSSVFQQLLFEQNPVDVTPFNPEIKIGKDTADIRIIMVSNLYCNPCKEAHQVLEQLIKNFPDRVQVSFRFLLSGKDFDQSPTSNQYLIEYWRQNIYSKGDESSNTAKLIHEWYKLMDLDKFKQQYPLKASHDFTLSQELETQHLDWIEKYDVDFTPTLFLNGKKLPHGYLIKDLFYLIADFQQEIHISA